MQPIKINSANNSQIDEFPSKDFLLPFGDNIALTTDGFYISLVEVTPDPEHAGEFKMEEDSEHIHVAIDDKRTLEGLERVVQVLRTMTAYELLTQHFNQQCISFYVNRDKDYVADYFDGEGALPVNEHGTREGQDY